MKISIWFTSLSPKWGRQFGLHREPTLTSFDPLALAKVKRGDPRGALLLRIGPKMDFMGFPQNFPYPNWSFWAFFLCGWYDRGESTPADKTLQKIKKKKKAEKIVTHQLSEKKSWRSGGGGGEGSASCKCTFWSGGLQCAFGSTRTVSQHLSEQVEDADNVVLRPAAAAHLPV